MGETAGDAAGGGDVGGVNDGGTAGPDPGGKRPSSTKEMVALWDKKVGKAEEETRKEETRKEEARAVALAKKGSSVL